MVVASARSAVSALTLAGVLSSVATAQVALQPRRVAVPAPTVSVSVPSATAARAETKPRLLWVRNDLTGQVLRPGETFADRDDTTEPKEVFNSFDHTGGFSSINISWNYPEAYTDPDFSPPEEGDSLRLALLNISSDPTDLGPGESVINGEKLSIMIEPWAAATWPSTDLNSPQPLATYQSALISISDDFEVRVFRSYMFSLMDITKPLNTNKLSPDFNVYKLDAALSFAFLSFPGLDIASPFEFDLTGFEPPITTKSRGVILTHWLVLSERPPCIGDLNNDAIVDDLDFQQFVLQYNIVDCASPEMPGGCSADLNFDGFVDDVDFTPFFVQAYNNVLCPEANVIRKVYVPLAGGRNKWDNDANNPFELDPITSELPNAVPVGVGGWTAELMPNPLVKTAPLPFGEKAGLLPSYAALRTTRTGFGRVSSLEDGRPFDQLQVEYERFLNQVLITPDAAIEFQYYLPIGPVTANSQWLSNSSPKKVKVLFPKPPKP
ncbi:MAG: hypothetical protein K2Y21_12690 [Phycisphaerales bacterium]|nr:hypothetical protein [Phycisphaerales bacterium]